jgi:hypothetical protein
MYSKAKPLALARSTMQPWESSIAGAVGERLADRAVDSAPLAVLALHDRDRPAQHRLADAVLSSPLHTAGDAPLVEGTEALARDAASVEDQLGEVVALGALRGPLVDPRSSDRAGELGPEDAVVGVRAARELDAHTGAIEDAVGDLGDLGGGLLGLHPDRLGADQPGLGASLHQRLLLDGKVDRLEIQELLERGDQRRQVDLLLVRDLLEQVVAAHQVLRPLVAQ